MAPSFANILIGKLEKDFLNQVTIKPTILWRYVDDIFAVFPHSEEHVKEFLQEIHVFLPTIKFTAEWFLESVTFLDVNVIRDGNRMVTDLYTKLTDTHQYLHHRSCHPFHCRKSIAFSQALKLQRICTKTTNYECHVK